MYIDYADWIIWTLIVLFIMFISGLVGYQICKQHAIEAGVAEYYLETPHSNQPKFRYKTELVPAKETH